MSNVRNIALLSLTILGLGILSPAFAQFYNYDRDNDWHRHNRDHVYERNQTYQYGILPEHNVGWHNRTYVNPGQHRGWFHRRYHRNVNNGYNDNNGYYGNGNYGY